MGVLSVGSLLRPLLSGASAVGVLRCSGCAFGQDAALAGRIDYVHELLRALGQPPGRARLLDSSVPAGEPPSPGAVPLPLHGREPALSLPKGARGEGAARTQGPSLFSPAAASAAIRLLAKDDPSCGVVAPGHAYSPLGVLTVQPAACTGCGACAEVCPTDALTCQREDGHVALTFDANVCNACGQCAAACPEAQAQALRLTRVTDLARLRQGPTVLYEDREARCEACGAAIAPLAMIRKVTALLGDEQAALAGRLARTCLTCREEPFSWLPGPTP